MKKVPKTFKGIIQRKLSNMDIKIVLFILQHMPIYNTHCGLNRNIR